MSAEGEEGEGSKHKRLGFDGNETPRLVHEDASTIAPHDIANDDLEDDSVAGGAGGDVVSARRKWGGHNWIEGVERDKRGNAIRACGIAGCQHMTGNPVHMKNHNASKHGINVVWFSCDQYNCDYKANEAGNLKRHKQQNHNICDVVWHQCDSCDYKAKLAGYLKNHKQDIHNIGVVWRHCNSCEYKAKRTSQLKEHKKRKH
ncbi:hypothetical protein TrLO_g1881 [Triparma laevis f. longispina]|uniref:C2H2-type domain-containing protein n=1 Tax=Triparma laevis f. longispina TaxID=1714387 RepID=A0A9W7FT94_9STRA|nr:hypothetical protein TrLO_g1881 [Triparma laevis f. longispina]